MFEACEKLQEDMTPAEVFFEDVRERAILARAAHHKYRAGKKPKLNNYTQKELFKMNGPITEYNQSKPMGWKEFKTLPTDTQKQYLQNIFSQYSIGPAALGEMFGTAAQNCGRYVCDKLGMEFPARYVSAKQKRKFLTDFCGQAPAPAPDEQQEPEEAAPVREEVQTAAPMPAPASAWLKRSVLNFSGPFNALDIAAKLDVLFAEGTNVNIQIEIAMGE